MLLSDSAPEILQRSVHRAVVQLIKALSAQYDDIETRQILLLPEGFPNLPFDPVSLNRPTEIFLGKNQADPGVTQ
jgi:hypothetical protein